MNFFTRKASVLPPDWPSPLHNKCSSRKCRHANPPQVAPGTYRCTGVPGGFFCEGTYKVSTKKAREAMSAAMNPAGSARQVGGVKERDGRRDMGRERDVGMVAAVAVEMERERERRDSRAREGCVPGARARREMQDYERVEGSYEAQGRSAVRASGVRGLPGGYERGRYGSTTPTSSGTTSSESTRGRFDSTPAPRYGQGYAGSVKPERFPFPGQYQQGDGQRQAAGAGRQSVQSSAGYPPRIRRPSTAQKEEEHRVDEAMMRRHPEQQIRPRWI